MPKLKTTKEFINDAIKIHGDKYSYSKVIYIKYKYIALAILFEKNYMTIFPQIVYNDKLSLEARDELCRKEFERIEKIQILE